MIAVSTVVMLERDQKEATLESMTHHSDLPDYRTAPDCYMYQSLLSDSHITMFIILIFHTCRSDSRRQGSMCSLLNTLFPLRNVFYEWQKCPLESEAHINRCVIFHIDYSSKWHFNCRKYVHNFSFPLQCKLSSFFSLTLKALMPISFPTKATSMLLPSWCFWVPFCSKWWTVSKMIHQK